MRNAKLGNHLNVIHNEKKLLDFNAIPVNLHWREDTKFFPACWILIGQLKFPARQPYARWLLKLKTEGQTINRKPQRQSYKIQIKYYFFLGKLNWTVRNPAQELRF